MPGMSRMKKINIKPLVPSRKLSIKNKGDDTTVIGMNESLVESPTTKTKPAGSIHELLEQMSVSPKSPDSKAGKMAAKRWQTNAKKVYEEFCTETSFTAITRIYKASSLFKKLAWLIVSLLFIVWMIVQIVWLFQKYFSYPVEVKVNLKAVSRLDFPSITVCNLNPLRRDAMHRGSFASVQDTFELDDDDMLYDDYLEDLREEWEEGNVTYDYNDMNFMNNYMQEKSYNKWDALENDTDIAERFYSEMDDEHEASMTYSSIATTMSDDDIKSMGHKKENLIMSCTWQGAGCSPSNFTYLRNNLYGNCYTFNAFDNGADSLYTTYAGPLMGLSLELNIEQHQYVPALASDAGVRITIHDRGVYPFPEDQGLSLPPGFKTSIGLKKTELNRLEPPHGECGKGGDGVTNLYMENFGTKYSKQTCFKSCFQALIIEKCGCAFAFYYVPAGVSPCSFDGNTSTCIEQSCTTLLDQCSDKCPTPCDEIKYDVTMSMSKWPGEQYEDHLDKKIQKADSHFMDEDERADSDDTLLKVVIYFEDLIYEKIEQEKAYESQNLISDIGGQLGLWLGLSAITIGEVIEFIAAISQLMLLKYRGGAKNKKPEGGKESETTKVTPLSVNDM